MKKQLGPVIFIAIGILLIAGSLVYLQFSRAIEEPEAAVLPEMVAGLSQMETNYGPDAVALVTDLHGQSFPLSSGAYGMYGREGSMAMLWVAGAPAKAMASKMVDEMEQAIATGNSPFTPTGKRDVNGRTLYELVGMGQRHYYFQSNSLVIWLAADETIAETALAETLTFYP